MKGFVLKYQGEIQQFCSAWLCLSASQEPPFLSLSPRSPSSQWKEVSCQSCVKDLSRFCIPVNKTYGGSPFCLGVSTGLYWLAVDHAMGMGDCSRHANFHHQWKNETVAAGMFG